MNKDLLLVSLRQNAVYLSSENKTFKAPDAATLAFAAELSQLGFALDEPLLHAIAQLGADDRNDLLEAFNTISGKNLNWAALVKGWQTPTGETFADHLATLFANVLIHNGIEVTGTTLPCGHLIPDGTFPLERYTGCPFCGAPFQTSNTVYTGQGSKKRLLTLWGKKEMSGHFAALLSSPVPLDATQRASLQALVALRRQFSETTDFTVIKMRETQTLVVDTLINGGEQQAAASLFVSPTDILRYLWSKKTGGLVIIQPSTLLRRKRKNLKYLWSSTQKIEARIDEERKAIKLHYSRGECRMVAQWLNQLSMPLAQQLEAMNSRREMWVRFIRALRLAEYSHRPGMEQLRELLDRFYRHDYKVWQGRVDVARSEGDGEAVLLLLRQRPGLFARCLFSTMLRFGPVKVIAAFREVLTQVPLRLLLTLGNHATLWFDTAAVRLAHPNGDVAVKLEPHPLLNSYSPDEIEAMKQLVTDLYIDALRLRYQCQEVGESKRRTMYIAPVLYDIPVSVGDRNETIQDTSCALQGQRFPVLGDNVRLFLQWGQGLPAQHLDMDLSCCILKDPSAGEKEPDLCAYFNLTAPGAKHSGDIQYIPDQVGTAEYIELSLPELEAYGAQRVVFACNAYTPGELSPNLWVGWMSSEYPMAVSDETGVAYDPSTVQHRVRVGDANLAKGLVFGVLDVARREITWLELPFDGQTVRDIDATTVDAYLRSLAAKPTIGQVLEIKAEAQHYTLVDEPAQATEEYTQLWAQDAAKVAVLLLT